MAANSTRCLWRSYKVIQAGWIVDGGLWEKCQEATNGLKTLILRSCTSFDNREKGEQLGENNEGAVNE